MPRHYLTGSQMKEKSDEELANLWNSLGSIFRQKNSIEVNQPVVVGFLELARETERRGLQIVENTFGCIVLQPKQKTA